MLTFVMSLNLDISWQLLKLYDIIPGNQRAGQRKEIDFMMIF